ncbi:HotDog domain-containing protein [Aspergillus germanicus]
MPPTRINHTRVGGYRAFINQIPVPESDLAFFATKPCARPYLDSSSAYRPVPFIARYEKHDTSDRFFSKTTNTASTIKHLLAVTRKEEDWAQRARDALTTEETEWRNPQTHGDEPDMVVFLDLDSDINGFRDTAHGGVLAAILDEVIGTAIIGYQQSAMGGESRLYTAYLNLTYRAPVETPGTVLIKTWLVRREGREWFTAAQLLGEDGGIRTEASGMWVAKEGNL